MRKAWILSVVFLSVSCTGRTEGATIVAVAGDENQGFGGSREAEDLVVIESPIRTEH